MTAEAAAEQSEPTMEEILASIRKIIATEGAPAQPAEDVLELTDIVEEEPAPEPQPAPEPVPEPEPVIEEVAAAAPPPAEPEPVEEKVEPPVETPADDTLVSQDAGATTATSFAQLAEQLEQQRAALAPQAEIGNGKQTLENLVTEIMKPLLKDWLDQNLPGTVEKLVQREIERIARRHTD